MSLSNRINMRGGSAEQPFIITDLTFVSGRAEYIDGGYRINGSNVEVDITIKVLSSGSYIGLVTNFPRAAATGNVTGVVNNLVMNDNGSVCTLQTSPSVTVNTTVRFRGTYAKL